MRNLKSLTYAAVLTLATACTGVFAQSSTTEELQSTGERIAILEAKLKEAELENKLLQQSAEIAQRGASAKRGSSLDFDTEYGTPTVLQVEGIKGSLEAVLVYRGNVRQRVREGDVVYGAIVKKIVLNEVTLLDPKSKKTQRLQFGTTPVTRDGGGMNGAGPLPSGAPGAFPSGPVVR